MIAPSPLSFFSDMKGPAPWDRLSAVVEWLGSLTCKDRGFLPKNRRLQRERAIF